jgi:hypothetical protein
MTTTDVEVDGKPAKLDTRSDEERLVELTTDQLIHEMAVAQRKRDEAASNRGHWGAEVKKFEGIIETHKKALIARDGYTPMQFHEAASEVEEEEDEDQGE